MRSVEYGSALLHIGTTNYRIAAESLEESAPFHPLRRALVILNFPFATLTTLREYATSCAAGTVDMVTSLTHGLSGVLMRRPQKGTII